FNVLVVMLPRYRCSDVRPEKPNKADPTNLSLHCRAGRSRHTDTRRHTNGRSCHAQHELARPPLHSQRRGNGGATPDALSASEDGSTTTGDSFLAMVPISA